MNKPLNHTEATNPCAAAKPSPPARPGPLSGITIIDVTRVVAGPYCAQMLADMGATVIKVEHPSDPDFVRSFPPFAPRQGAGADAADAADAADPAAAPAGSGYFAQYNRHKLGVSLDLKRAEGKALFLEMIGRADIVIENFRPGTMDKLGLGWATLQAANPRLIYTAISGFGQTGPNSRRPAFDGTAQAAGGLWSMNGMAGQPPMRVGSIIGDLAASFYATIGTLAALREVERSGVGQRVDISQQDSVLTLTESAVSHYTLDGVVAAPQGNHHPFGRPYGQYACLDGFVFFGSYSDKLWREACAVFGEPELANDPEIDTMVKRFDAATYERRLKPIIERWFSSRTKAELEALAGDRIVLTPIKTMDEVVADPHLRARAMFMPVQVGGPGGASIEVFASPIKLSATPAPTVGAAPDLGEHNRAVYLEWLGMGLERFERLSRDGVI